MNEEDTGPLFKYTPEISSQFLIQSNENPEFVQVPGICDDLLLTGFEDGTVTWTLGGLPVLLNEQQPLLVNQINTDSEPQQELLQDILSQAAIEIANSDEAASIECPLEIPDKEFLTNNGLLISNEPDLPQQYVKHSESADEIQSSDVSSQEAFIDISGLLIPQESILSLNNDDLLFNIEHAHQPSSSIKSNKARTRRKVPTLVQNQDEELRVEKNPETVFTYDEPPNNKLVKVLNLDGTMSMLNVDGMLAGNLKQISDITPVTADELFLKDEQDLTSIQPDSTVMNDETFNIDDLATIITAYQCKKCAFTCNDQKLFLKHFKTTHIPIQPIRTAPEPLDTLTKIITGSTLRPAERTLNQFKILNSGEIVTRLTFLRNPKDTFILPAEAIKTDEPEFEMKNAELESLENKIKTEIFNIENSFKIEPPDTPVPNNENNNSEFLHVSIIDDDNFEKRIMRVKRKKKTTPMYNNKKQMIAKQQGSYIGARKEIHEQCNRNSLLQLDNDEPRSAAKDVRLSDPKALRKQLLYLCSDCGKEFSTVEDCRTHMIRIHKFRNVEAVGKQPDESKEALGIIDNPVPESEDGDDNNDGKNKNKKIIDKFLTQDIMKPRRNKCTKTGCQYRFAKPELLARHESCHVEGVRGVFKCPECGEKQTSWRLCSVHLWRCHQLDVDLYACPLCTFKGSTFVKLKHHLKIHGDERDYICTECDRAFKQPSQLRNHRVIHLDPAIHEVPHWYIQKHCDKCGKMFADSKCLKKHVQAVHSKLKPFICNVCGHTCARKAMLQMHLRQHTGEKPYSCKLCYYKTGDHNSLRRHEMRHTGARPYKCPHCDYTAIQSNSYKNHLASKHPGMSGSFSCTDCNFKTVNEDSFVSHLNDHKIGLIEKSDESDPKISRIRILYDQSNLTTADIITTDNKNGIIIQLPNSKNFDLEDDETQNCFLSIGDLNDEQTVDTGGITIPADPDPMNM